jgi:PAS domain S-box-containing protein
VQPEYLATVRSNIRHDLKGESTPAVEMGMLRVDGGPITIEGRGVRAIINGEPAVQVAMRDITERKRAEEELFKSRQMLQLVLDTIPVRVFWKDRNSVYLGCNKALALDAGYEDPAELIGKTDYETASETIADAYRSDDREVMETGRPKIGFEELQVRPDRSPAWLRTNKVPLRTMVGDIVGILGTYEDITDQKQTEETLKMSEERYRTVFENTGTATTVIEENTLISLVNAEFERLSGYTKAEIEGKMGWTEFVAEEDRKRMLAQHTQRRQRGQEALKQYEFHFRTKGGQIRRIFLTIDTIPGTGQSIASLLDITDQKEKEDALRASEERYRHLLERSFNAVVIHKDGKIIVANDAAVAMAGTTSRQDLIGKPITAFIHPKSRQLVQERVEKMLQVPGRVMPLTRETFLRLDGKPFDVEVMATSFLDEGAPAIQIIFREIPEAAKMEVALRKSEEIYRTIAESAADMIYITDNNGVLTFVNMLCARMFGCKPSDLCGKRQEDLFPPDIARKHLTCISQVVATGGPVEHEESIPTPAGTFRIDVKLSPIRSQDGTVVSVVGIARDITSRKPGTSGRGE